MVELLDEGMQGTVSRLGYNSLRLADVKALNEILYEFSSRAKLRSFDEWQHLARINYMSVAHIFRKGIVGMATLVTFQIPTGAIGLVEDVAVLESMRGRGLGELLMRDLMREARARLLKHVDLTTRQKRVEANGLYQKLGFVQRETNVYRLTL